MPFFGEYNSRKSLSRREALGFFARMTGAVVLSEAVSHRIGPADILHGYEQVYIYGEIAKDYGPEVARAVVTRKGPAWDAIRASWDRPGDALEAFKLWRPPAKTYLDSPFFNNRENRLASIVYRKGAPNNLIAFGDSNMLGPIQSNGKHKVEDSPVVLYARILIDKYKINNWDTVNLAKSGSTTEMTIKQQVQSAEAENILKNNKGIKCDVWINAGGNDIANIVTTEQEVSELQRIAENPFKDIDLLFRYTKKIDDYIKTFEGNFELLLKAIYAINPEQIRQFVVMSLPDFGKANSIITEEINGKAHYMYLKNDAVRQLIGNISTLMNNAMFRAVSKFHEEIKERDKIGVKIVGINTATSNISKFSSNQHFSMEACRQIAQVAASRVAILGS